MVGIVGIGAPLALSWFHGLDEQTAISRVSASVFSRARLRPDALIGVYRDIEAGVEKLERSL